jgi:hypothetical protein
MRHGHDSGNAEGGPRLRLLKKTSTRAELLIA